ncbi:MAG: phenylalanine--tRNA ligase subunit alpha, partial [Patescibacteria group bacterium]
MQEKLNNLKREILEELAKAGDLKVLREIEIKFFGRKGMFTKALHNIKDLEIEEKKKIGILANDIKKELAKKLAEAKKIIVGKTKKAGLVDVTLPGEKIKQGHLHPITRMQSELEDLFTSLGFMILDGPELESDY